MDWNPQLVAQYREEFIAPGCEQCTTPCCVFRDLPDGSPYVMPIDDDARRTVCDGGMASTWPIPHLGAQAILDAVATKIVDGPCPSFVAGRCFVYEHRPNGCRVWPVYDGREGEGDPDGPAEVHGFAVCHALDRYHFRTWLQRETGTRLHLEQSGNSWTVTAVTPRREG